jgi:hypothetical protein
LLDQSTITAHELLHAFLEMHGLAPNLSDWTEEGLAWNPPRHIRLRRLKAMFLAFGIAWDPMGFTEGRCVDTVLAFDSIKNQAKAELGIPLQDMTAHHLRFFFVSFADTARPLRQYCPAGWTKRTGFFLLACKKIADVQQAIQTKIDPIDSLLAEMIDPRKQSFTVEQLIQDYGYPIDDLHKIDCDHW